jgi:hypothetical protein
VRQLNDPDLVAREYASRDDRRRLDSTGEVLWQSRDELEAYLEAYGEIAGPLDAPEGPYPFRASRRNCVFVASKS